jgi:hypothetical protein
MTVQPTKIEQGSGASMLEAIFDVRGNGVFGRAAGPCRKSTVGILRDPRLPAVIVGRDPQPDLLCVLVVSHVHPFVRPSSTATTATLPCERPVIVVLHA